MIIGTKDGNAMKTERILALAFLLLASVSCRVQEWTVEEESVMRFYATGEGGTRTQLDSEWLGRILWNPSEEILVTCKDIQGKFVSTNTEPTSKTVTFVGTLPVTDRGESPYWAVYPYGNAQDIDGMTAKVTLPSEQKAMAGQIEEGLMVSMARSKDHNLYFRHLFGVIRFGVFEDGIKKVVFKGNEGEILAGRARAGFDEEGIPVLSGFEDTSQEITLLPPDGETFKNGAAYYVVCFPGSFRSGYTIELYRDELVSMKKIDTPVELLRGSMVQLFDLYTGGIIYSTESQGKTYSVRYKVEWENKRNMAEYWVTIDGKRISIPGKYEVSKNDSPTKMGPAVAIETDTETVYFALAKADWNGALPGDVYIVKSSGYEVKHPVVGLYPYFRFDEGQQRMELHSFDPFWAARTTEYLIYYHDRDGEWKKKITRSESLEYEESGNYLKQLSDILCLYDAQPPSEVTKTAVNLGLSVNWAECNLGATAPERFGDYYAWGETETKTDYSWLTYRFFEGEYLYVNDPIRYIWYENRHYVPIFTKYNHLDNKTVLDPEDDVAHVKWGDHWRLPTPGEWQELFENCTWENATVNGVTGLKGTSLINGKTIFLPQACYWEGDALQEDEVYPREAIYHSSQTDREWSGQSYHRTSYLVGTESALVDSEYPQTTYQYRWVGLPVRAVYDHIAIDEVLLDASSLRMIPEDSARLTVTIDPFNATNPAVSWTSSDETVAKVSPSGEVESLKEGTATITVTALDGGKSASCRVVVSYLDTPDKVDLGLSVKWASFNVGATKPEETGYYYSWGEKKPKEDYPMEFYQWRADERLFSLTKYCLDPAHGFNGFADYKKVLDLEDDAACFSLGGKWRMPTAEEMEELLDKTDCTPATLNGVSGCWLTSKVNGNRIFLPLSGLRYNNGLESLGTGYCWSSTVYPVYDWNAHCLSFDPYAYMNYTGREEGLPIRAVYDDSVHSGGNEGITPGGDINM